MYLSQIAIETVFGRPFSSASPYYLSCCISFILFKALRSTDFYLLFFDGKFLFKQNATEQEKNKKKKKIFIILAASKIFDANFVLLLNSFHGKKTETHFIVHLLGPRNVCVCMCIFDVSLKYFPVRRRRTTAKKSLSCVPFYSLFLPLNTKKNWHEQREKHMTKHSTVIKLCMQIMCFVSCCVVQQ